MTTMTMNPMMKMVAVSPLAITITFGLVMLMYSLVHRDYVEPPVKPQPKIPPIVMDNPGPIPTIINAPKPPEAVEPPPETKIEPKVEQAEVATGSLVNKKITFNNGTNKIGMGDGALMPFYRVPPRYPERAITRGIEGYVDLVFDVTPTGATTNIRVTYAEPVGYFEKAATKAIKRWKYKPQVVDGLPQAARDQATRLEFQLEK
ncbi:MAG: TonB family protein [Cellvibrionaceae bacterium]